MNKNQLDEIYSIMLYDNNAEAFTVEYDRYYEIHLEWETHSNWPYDDPNVYIERKTIAFPK